MSSLPSQSPLPKFPAPPPLHRQIWPLLSGAEESSDVEKSADAGGLSSVPMQTRLRRSWEACGPIVAALVLGSALPSAADLPAIPDGSTVTEVRDAVTGSSTDCSDCLIQGNTHNGEGHLFHSFSEFNVPTGATVTFDNTALDGTPIDRIFSRVTGTEATEILGELGALGETDLFLINPKGLLIGPGAVLNLGGSFVGSTAEAIAFSNNSRFSAQDPGLSPLLLTVNTPIGLQFGSNVAPVEVQSVEINFPGKTLALAGGEAISPGPISEGDATGIRLRNSNLFLTSGGLQLASLAPQEFWRFADTPTGLVFVSQPLDEIAFGNLFLEETTIQGLNLPTGGDTALYGDVVELEDSHIFLESDGTGSLGPLFLAAQQLTLDDSALRTVNSLQGGLITLQKHSPNSTLNSLNANPFIELKDSEISSTTVGDGGDIQIGTFGNISLEDGSDIVTRTETGTAGNINILLSSTNFLFSPAGTLSLDDGSRISTVTNNVGGNINISSTVSSLLSEENSGKLTLQNGSYISAESNPGNNSGGRVSIPLDPFAFESITSQGLGQDNDIFVVGSTQPPNLGATLAGFDLSGTVVRDNNRSEIGIAESAPESFTSRFTPFSPSIPSQPPSSSPITLPTVLTSPPLPTPAPVSTTPTPTPTPTTFTPPTVNSPPEPPQPLISIESPIELPPRNNFLLTTTFEEAEIGLVQALPLTTNQKQAIIAALVLSQQKHQSRTDNTEERQQLTAAGAPRNGNSSWIHPGCPVGEGANFAGLNILGLGGVPAAPNRLVSNSDILVDLGSIASDAVALDAAMSDAAVANSPQRSSAGTMIPSHRLIQSRSPQTLPSSVQEAVGWQVSHSGTVRLMSAQQAIAHPPANHISNIFPSSQALALGGLRLGCFPS